MQLFDLAYLEHLASGDNEFLDSLIDIFVTNTPIAIDDIKEAFNRKDYETIHRTAHRIKPSIYFLKIDSIANEIKALSMLDKVKLSEKDLKSAITKIDVITKNVIIELKNNNH